MLRVLRKIVGDLETNCYIIIFDKDCLIIDPGYDGDYILEEISRQNLKIRGVLATHGHYDHVLAASEILLYAKCQFYLCGKDEFIFKRANETARYFSGVNPITLSAPKFAKLKNKKMAIKNFNFEAIQTPGHTPGSVSFYFKDDGVIFTGDTVFQGGVGSTDHSYSSKNDLLNSIMKLRKLPSEVLVYPGHGELTKIAFLPDTF